MLYNRENGVEPPQHVCPRNYEGSSKVKETDAALHLYTELYEPSNKCLYLKAIVVDDDSSMRALLKHTITNPKGRLPQEMTEPEWLADQSHRTKMATKPVYYLANLAKSISPCTKADAIRFKRYYGHMIKTNRMKNISETMLASNAVVEHLFDNHEYCDERWCKPNRKKRKRRGGAYSVN